MVTDALLPSRYPCAEAESSRLPRHFGQAAGVGTVVGCGVGTAVGASEGACEGGVDGKGDGADVGASEGACEGGVDGKGDGADDGKGVGLGDTVGLGVNASAIMSSMSADERVIEYSKVADSPGAKFVSNAMPIMVSARVENP